MFFFIIWFYILTLFFTKVKYKDFARDCVASNQKYLFSDSKSINFFFWKQEHFPQLLLNSLIC